MDHSSAHVMEYTRDPIETKTIESAFTHDDKAHTLSRSEKEMHNKDQHQEAEYYKYLGSIIRNYTDVILFGPTDAKVELYNLLKADHRFAGIKLKTIQKDKMTDNQQHAFVKEYFLEHWL